MKIIDFKTISEQHFSPLQCIEWVEYILKHKYECYLPAISLSGSNADFA